MDYRTEEAKLTKLNNCKWTMWNDGSGSLQDSSGKKLFEYDLQTSEMKFANDSWERFDGSLKEIQEYAETVISNKMKNKQRLFVDMDGTLAQFKTLDTLEPLFEKGYFENLAPQQNVIDAVKEIIQNHKDIEVYILSAYLQERLCTRWNKRN